MGERKSRWSVVVTKTHFVKTPEKDEICCGNPALTGAYDHLFMQWIGAGELLRRFSYLFTNFVHFEDVPAVITVFQSGLVAYAEILQKKDRHYYPHERLKHFLTGCFANAKKLCRFVVIDKDEEEQGTLFQEMPLFLWRFDRKALCTGKSDTDQEEFSALLYRKVVPENMKLAMRRFKHEAAIMAGNLGDRH